MQSGKPTHAPAPAGSIPAPEQLLGPRDLFQRWKCGSPSTLWRAEVDGFLIPRRHGALRGYAWEDVWIFEGGLPPDGRETEYRAPLMAPEEVARLCPLAPSTILSKARSGQIPHRRIGRSYRFVPAEVARWLEGWT